MHIFLVSYIVSKFISFIIWLPSFFMHKYCIGKKNVAVIYFSKSSYLNLINLAILYFIKLLQLVYKTFYYYFIFE